MTNDVTVRVKRGDISTAGGPAVVVNLYQGTSDPAGATAAVDGAIDGAVTRALSSGDVTGRLGEVTVIYPDEGKAERVLVVGLGKQADFDLAAARTVGGAMARKLRELGVTSATSVLHGGESGLPGEDLARALTEGFLLALYRYTKWFQDGRDEPIQLESLTWLEKHAARARAATRGAKHGAEVAGAMALTRDLVNGPPNEVTPTHLADTAKALGKEFGLKVTVLDKAQCEKLGMGAFLGVAAAAHEPCKFMVMDYTPKGRSRGTVCLVGKGITFDTGGISLKPAPEMDLMKYDMGGAGAVFGAMRFAASAKVPLRVVGIVASTENMPGGGAYKPGDILTSMAGTTIEIKNTDAEGRLVLSDALAYAERYEPDAVIDLATLTGACVIALGDATAAMGNDEWLLDRIVAAADTGGERMWAMPLWPEHREAVKSTVADIRNSTGREAGSLTAGAFLGAFTNAYRWVHLDIAGAAWNNKPTGTMDAGAAGGGVRAVCQFLHDWKKPAGKGPKPGPRTSLRAVAGKPKAKSQAVPARSAKAAPARKAKKKTTRKRK